MYGLENIVIDGNEIAPRSLKLSINEVGSTASFPTTIGGHQTSSSNYSQSMPTYCFYDVKIEIGKISLTGITPTNTTALSVFSGDQSVLTLTNRASHVNLSDKSELLAKILNELDFTLKPSIEAKCNLSVELKTSLKSDENKNQQTQQQQPQDVCEI